MLRIRQFPSYVPNLIALEHPTDGITITPD